MRLPLFLLALLQVNQILSVGMSCSTEDIQNCGKCKNVACVAHNDNVIKTIGGVSTADECQEMCESENGCSFITYFEKGAFPLENFCYLLSSCANQNDCFNCITESVDCVCSSNMIGKIDNENLLNDLFDVNSEKDCHHECAKYSG